MNTCNWQEVYTYWFEELGESGWFEGSEAVDAEITKRFAGTHEAVVEGAGSEWRDSAKGRLAEIIVLDQFSRNIYRKDAKAFVYDEQALALAREAILHNAEAELNESERQFLYMPFMHSESAKAQEESLAYFERLGNESALHYAKVHKEIIDRFGRYPHRNEQLGRESTDEERAYLEDTTESFFSS